MDVSVIILSFNTTDLLKSCIESVLTHTKDVNFEIIVVDNASTDNSVEVVKSFGEKVKLIQSPDNSGFSKGNNLAIKEAKGKYVLLLNSDTQFLENSLFRMFAWMEAHSNMAVSSCQLVNSEQQITFTGGFFPTMPRIILWAFFLDDVPFLNKFINSYHPKWGAEERFSKEFSPDWVTGAFFLMRKIVIDKIGLLDENIFMYGEELEWCLRAKNAGFQVGFTPITKIVHLERRSSGGLPERAVLGEFKGLKYIYQKYYSPISQYMLDIILVFAAFLRVIIYIVILKPQMAKVYLKAMTL